MNLSSMPRVGEDGWTAHLDCQRCIWIELKPILWLRLENPLLCVCGHSSELDWSLGSQADDVKYSEICFDDLLGVRTGRKDTAEVTQSLNHSINTLTHCRFFDAPFPLAVNTPSLRSFWLGPIFLSRSFLPALHEPTQYTLWKISNYGYTCCFRGRRWCRCEAYCQCEQWHTVKPWGYCKVEVSIYHTSRRTRIMTFTDGNLTDT